MLNLFNLHLSEKRDCHPYLWATLMIMKFNEQIKIITIIIKEKSYLYKKLISVIEKFKKNIDIIIIDDFSLKYKE